jgi:hypothetical protein
MRNYILDLVQHTYPTNVTIKEVERIVEVPRDVERIVHKEVFVEKEKRVEVPKEIYKEIYKEV